MTVPPAGTPEGILVVGMHRSGTSAATRLVNMLGLPLCVEDDLLRQLDGNETGHWESTTMCQLNEQMLAQMGRAWWCPPPSGAAYAEAAGRIELDPAAARASFDAAHPAGPWVAKDPRTCLTLPFWRRALDRPLAVVFMYRNPVEVAASLLKRNVFSFPRSVATWDRYNRLALEHLAGLPTHVSRYDDLVTDPVGWCTQIAEFLEWCGLKPEMPSPAAIESFIEPRLRHSTHAVADIKARFVTSLPVFEALESRLGSSEAFQTPSLPPEPSWVEAEFVAIGAIQPEPLPQPLSPYTSLIVLGLGHPLASVLTALLEEIKPFAEGVVVTDALLPDGRDPGIGSLTEVAKAKRVRVTVMQVPPGTPTGAARAAGVELATTDLLDFRDFGATNGGWWPTESRRAFSAGYAAATPHLTSNESGGGGFGLERAGERGELAWAGAPVDRLGDVELLAPQCFAIRREVLAAVGGFRKDLPRGDDAGEDVYELSARLRANGYRIAATRDAVVTVPYERLARIASAGRADTGRKPMSSIPSAAAAGTIEIGGDLVVNRLGYGAMRVTGSGIWGDPPDHDRAIEALRRAIELEVNFIDTADAYGPDVSENLIAEALHPYPEDLVIATKGGLVRPGPGRWDPDGRPSHLREACEGSLERLRLERIDVYQLHRPDPAVPLAESIGALVELQSEGKIRHIALCNVTEEQLAEARAMTPIVSVQNRYNATDRGSEELVDICARERLAFLPWAPIQDTARNAAVAEAGERLGATERQVVLAWLLLRSAAVLPIPGSGSADHIAENVAAASLLLTPEEVEAITAGAG